ncbi:HDOD domain-containing protein [Candidatus Auribacterota bacterium]
MDKQRLQSIVNRIYDLPTLPVVVNKLSEVVGDPKSCANDIAKIIATDQALTSKILKIANSAFYGLRNPIANISLAVVILGYKSIKSLALGVSVFDMFEENEEATGFSMVDYWKHSLAVGLCARIISKKTKIGIAEEQFVCGLLHDIGEMLFYKYAEDDFHKAITLLEKDRNLTIEAAEKKIFAFDHTDIGEWLAEKWRLPILTKKAIKEHHDFSQILKIDNASLKSEVAMIYFSDIFCKQLGYRYGGEKKIGDIPDELYQLLRISKDDNEVLTENLAEEMEKSESYLQLKGSKKEETEVKEKAAQAK